MSFIYVRFTASYDKHDIARNRLSITCGNGSTTSTYSTQSTYKTTKMTQITSSLQQTTQAAMTTTNMLTTTSVPTTTTTLNLNYEFDIANFTSTEGTVSTKQASQPRIKGNLCYNCEKFITSTLLSLIVTY